MPIRKIGIVVDGATGRLGSTQHLKALLAIRGEGGLPLANGDRLMPEPVLLGRNPEKLAALAAKNDGLRWYKQGFGGTEVPMTYYYYPRPGYADELRETLISRPAAPAMIARALTRWLPGAALEAVGGLLFKHVG